MAVETSQEDNLVIELVRAVAACNEDCGFSWKQVGDGRARIISIRENNPETYVRFYPRIVGAGMRNLKKIESIYNRSCRKHGIGKIVISPPSNSTPPNRERFRSNSSWGIDQALPLAKKVFGLICSNAKVHGSDTGGEVIIIEVAKADEDAVSDVRELFDTIGKANGKQVIVIQA